MSFKDPLWLEEKAKYLDRKVQTQRELAECIQNFEFTSLPQYSPHVAKHLPFIEYFYPWEKLYLRTKNFEKFSCRTKKSNKCFRNYGDLVDYTREMSDPSSNNEDIPPASEELFFDTSLENLHETVLQQTGYAPRLTLLQRSLLRDLGAHQLSDPDTGLDLQKRTIAKRLELIRGHCKDLKRKRYAKSYRRFTRVRSKRLRLEDEGLELMAAELCDKDLGREFYYAENEPKELLSVLQSRRNAVHKKYMQYVGDATFRRAFQARIYYNVNRDAPAVAENGPQWSQHGDAPTKELSHVRRCNAVRMRGGQSGASSERRVQWPTGLTRTRGPYQEASVDSSKADLMMFERFNFDSLVSQQADSDLPTSEAEQMSDMGAATSQHMRCRRQRLLKSLHRLLRVEALGAMPPNEMASHLCYLEMMDKGLFEENVAAEPRGAERVLAVSKKFRKFASDRAFRERYLQRVRSIKPELHELSGFRGAHNEQADDVSDGLMTAGSEYSDVTADRGFEQDDVSDGLMTAESQYSDATADRGFVDEQLADAEEFFDDMVESDGDLYMPEDPFGDLPEKTSPKELQQRFMAALKASSEPAYYQSSSAMSVVTRSSDPNQSETSYYCKVDYEVPPVAASLEISYPPGVESFKYSEDVSLVDSEGIPEDKDQSEDETEFTAEEYEDVYADNSDEIDRTSPGIFERSQSADEESASSTEQSGEYFFNEGTPSQGKPDRKFYIIRDLVGHEPQDSFIDDVARLGPVVGLPTISPQTSFEELPQFVHPQSPIIDDDLPSPEASKQISWVGLDDVQAANWSPYARDRLPKGLSLREDNDLDWSDDGDDVARGDPQALPVHYDEKFLLTVHRKARELAEKFCMGRRPLPGKTEDGDETVTIHVTQNRASTEQTDNNDDDDAVRTAYADITTAESSFDDEVPSSEDEAFPSGPILRRPVDNEYAAMSRMKMQLFVALAELDHDNRTRNAPAYELEAKRMFRIRRFHARLIKRRRKAAVVRLFKLGIKHIDINDRENMLLYLRHQERKDKGLSQRKYYYDEREPSHLTKVLQSRGVAIANKFTALNRGNYELAMYVRSVIMGLDEKIELIHC